MEIHRVRTNPSDILLWNLLQPSAKLSNDIRRKTPRQQMLVSFRAKRFSSYYNTATNTKVRHSVKFEFVFLHACVYQSLSQLSFYFLTNGLFLKFSLWKHKYTWGIKVTIANRWGISKTLPKRKSIICRIKFLFIVAASTEIPHYQKELSDLL